MPIKRKTRVKGQGKQKSSKSKESSSEDTDQCTAEDIVSRLAKKYLLKSSTDTEHSDQKENERSGATVAADPYDADLETSEVDTAASVDTASDMECLDAQPTPHILSPSRQANAGMARSTRSRGAFAVGNPNKSMQRAKPTVHPPAVSTRESSAPSQPNRRHHASRKSSGTPQRTPMESVCTPKEDSLQQSDSGMFVSPLMSLPRRHLPKMNATDTSTPTSTIGSIQSDLNDSCFGFENLASPDPLGPISPVDPVSPIDHPSLSRSSPSDISTTRRSRRTSASYTVEPVKRKVSAALDMSSLVLDVQQPVKKPRKKAVKTDPEKMARMQEWAANMAEEFEDIEMNYDLTIE